MHPPPPVCVSSVRPQDTLEPTTAEKLRAVPCGAAAALSNAHWLPWLPAAAAKACQQLSPPVDAVRRRLGLGWGCGDGLTVDVASRRQTV